MVPLHFITSFSVTLNGIKLVRFINSLKREKEAHGRGPSNNSSLAAGNVL